MGKEKISEIANNFSNDIEDQFLQILYQKIEEKNLPFENGGRKELMLAMRTGAILACLRSDIENRLSDISMVIERFIDGEEIGL